MGIRTKRPVWTVAMVAVVSRDMRSFHSALTACQVSSSSPSSFTRFMIRPMSRSIRETIAAEPRATLKGCDIVWISDFNPAAGPLTSPVAIMISVEFGEGDDTVLLIDQREIDP